MTQLAALIVDESKWLTMSLGLAIMAVAVLLYRQRQSDLVLRRRVLAAMTLFFGVTIGTMALGHLAAVTTKLGSGTLQGRVPVFYAIGIALAVPSWWLIVHTRKILVPGADHQRATMVLNAWMAVTLLALGLPNLPLAFPAFLNIAYHLHNGRFVGWAIVGVAVIVYGGLFFGSVVFLSSGQSFERFKGME